MQMGTGAQVCNTSAALWQVTPLQMPTVETRSMPDVAILQPGKGIFTHLASSVEWDPPASWHLHGCPGCLCHWQSSCSMTQAVSQSAFGICQPCQVQIQEIYASPRPATATPRLMAIAPLRRLHSTDHLRQSQPCMQSGAV